MLVALLHTVIVDSDSWSLNFKETLNCQRRFFGLFNCSCVKMNGKKEEYVKVYVRIKPPTTPSPLCVEVISEEPPVLFVPDKGLTYNFDNIFSADCSQQEIYNDTVAPLVESVKNGYNCTVFAYGQTGTGKTYTMGTNLEVYGKDNIGLISRTLDDFLKPTDNEETEISISFIEIYNEKVFDLLEEKAENRKPLVVKASRAHGFQEKRVSTTYDAELLLRKGGKNRHTGATKQNTNSSRSHAVFTIYCRLKNSEGGETVSKLNLVDLAGSECVKKTGSQGNEFKEGVSIKQGLLRLSLVIQGLSNKQNVHISYRESVLTYILQDSLNKKNVMSFIVCISSNIEDVAKTCQTLDFASGVKRVRNKPEVVKVVKQFQQSNPAYFQARGVTPMKRSGLLSLDETPFKRSQLSLLPPLQDDSSNFSIASTSSTSSLSSFATQIPPQPMTLTPIVRKCMVEIEKKMETVIMNTVQRVDNDRRLTILQNKENECDLTPTFTWNKMSKLVKKELQEMMGATIKMPTSSPIPTVEKELPRKLLSYEEKDYTNKEIDCESIDQSHVSQATEPNATQKETETQIFKEPNPPLPVRKSKTLKKLRRSTRISIRNLDHSFCWENTSENKSRRRSVRLQKKDVPLESPSVTRMRLTVLGKDSPLTARTKRIIKIINSGTQKDLERLQTVGKKTAEKILIFRQLNGGIANISDLSKVFTKNLFKRFKRENFLRDDSF